MHKIRIILVPGGTPYHHVGARMLAALFGNHWMYGCQQLHWLMGNDTNARAGTMPDPSRSPPPPPPEGVGGGFKPGDYDPPYDRNILLSWASLYIESIARDLSTQFDPLVIHRQFCEDPCVHAEVLAPLELKEMESVYGDSIEFFKDPYRICQNWAPLLSYGSLSQMQEIYASEAYDPTRHPEDITLKPGVL